MDISEFGFRLLLLFLPGILCAYIVDSLTVHSPRQPFCFLLRSFVLGAFSYLIYWAVITLGVAIVPQIFPAGIIFDKALTDPKVQVSFKEIIYACGSAVFLGGFLTLASRHKWGNRLARWIGLTKKFGELDVWGYMLNSADVEWVTVRDHANDLVFDGWVQAFSDNSRDAELLLRDVSVYRNSTGERLYQLGLLYVSRERETISIECRAVPIDDRVLWKEDESHGNTEGRTAAPAETGACDQRGRCEEGRSEPAADDTPAPAP